jgi:cell wall-associated NlpC family hydrolase
MLSGKTLRGWLVLETRWKGKTVYFSDAPKIKQKRRIIRAKKWPSHTFGEIAIHIAKLEPEIPNQGIYDNTGRMEPYWHPEERKDHPKKWHWCPIQYQETMVGRESNKWRHQLDTKPTTSKYHRDLGTMRYVARVTWKQRRYWSPGKNHRDKGGVRPGIATVRVRRDNSAVGYMTELMNVPYVYGSSSTSGRLADHQTERAVGADCADLIVYGWRRAGRKIDYTWSQGLKSHTRRTAHVAQLLEGRYREQNGLPIKFGQDIQVGDIILWNRHVAVVASADSSGYLTPNTEILHTIMETPKLTKLANVGFGFDTPPFQIRRPRWKKQPSRTRRTAQR